MTDLAGFEKRQEFLVCVDSDGCATDTNGNLNIYYFAGSHLHQRLRLKALYMEALIDKLVSRRDAFVGDDSIDSFCGLWDARI